ncbi:hypothetical protein D3C81_829110 [compost metagenome]
MISQAPGRMITNCDGSSILLSANPSLGEPPTASESGVTPILEYHVHEKVRGYSVKCIGIRDRG